MIGPSRLTAKPLILILGMTLALLTAPEPLSHTTSTQAWTWGDDTGSLGFHEPSDGPSPARIINPLTEDTLAALTVYLEARGESFAGKLAVAAVIRNRMNARYHSDGTVKGTVLRPYQFEPWLHLRPHQVRFDPSKAGMRDSLLAWRLVQDGRKIVKGALLFFNPRLVQPPMWAKRGIKVASIGAHEFYVPSRTGRNATHKYQKVTPL